MAVVQVTPLKEKFNREFAQQILVLKGMAKARSGAQDAVRVPAAVLPQAKADPRRNEEVVHQAMPQPIQPKPQPATQTFDGKDYVLIQGKYYEYRADNVYLVNGVRTFFKKNREPAVNAALPVQQARAPQLANAAKPGAESSGIPVTPSEMIKALEDAKTAIHNREMMLDSENP